MLHSSHATRVAAAFGLGGSARLEGPVARGRLGQIWRLTTDRGRYAVKESRFGLAAEDAERDAAYQDVVRRSGVPMPAVVRSTSGGVLADVDGPVRVYEWVDVRGPDRHLDPVAVGRTVAAVHRVVVPTDDAVDGWYVDPVGADAWHDVLDRLRSAGAPFTDRLAAVLPSVLEAEAVLSAPEDVRVCHRDLWADNLLRTAGGGLVALDWENSGPGSPSQELGVVLFEFGVGDPTRMRALHAAYVAAGGQARLRWPGDLTMLVAQTGHIAQIGCQRWLAAETDTERADNAAWVREFLDEPVTLHTVETILRAVAG